MNYNEFQERLKEELQNRVSSDISLCPVTSTKNNHTLKDGFQLQNDTSNVGIILYLDDWYSAFLEGTTLSDIADKFMEMYQCATAVTLPDTNILTNYESIREKIFYKLINFKENQQELKDIPYIPYLDLAIVFYVLLDCDENNMKSMQIRSKHLELWKKELPDLFSDAKRNTEKFLPAEFLSMSDILKEVSYDVELNSETDGSALPKMYVLTNAIRQYGAISFLQEGTLQQISEKLQEDFFLLPSSVHEVILVKAAGLCAASLNEMIQDINETNVLPEDVLSDHAYFYSCSRKELLCA
ncbi:DUF5688 family protein [Faecalimonas umbilicata]|nr:DUF5688 family protein [Faecalimonas umbilicata]